jgi:hypothetical protein
MFIPRRRYGMDKYIQKRATHNIDSNTTAEWRLGYSVVCRIIIAKQPSFTKY